MTADQNTRTDAIKVRGIFTMLKRDATTDEILEEYIDRNLVVNVGRDNLAQLLGGGSGTEVSQFSAGTNGADPLVTDTAITSPFTKAVTSVTYPATGQVAFNWSIEANEANGLDIREFGLILATSGDLFARKTRSLISKDNTFRLEGTWTIIF